jgi:signal transduction histidine kinase
MRARGGIGFRREVIILVPAMLLVVFVLAVFTLRSYRNAVAMFEEEARIEALETARGAASALAREREGVLSPPTPDRLEALAPAVIAVMLVDAQGTVLALAGQTPSAGPFDPLDGRAPLEAVAIGPGGKAADRVIAFAPLGRQQRRQYLRLDFDAQTLASQHRNVQILSVVVIALGIGVGALSISFARHLLAPLDTLLERARAAVPETGETDEIPFLLDTFDRALAALSHDHAVEDDDISLLGKTLTPSLDCGLLLLSPQGRILALNTLGRSLLGVDEPISGEAYDEVLALCPEVVAVLAAALAGDKVDPRTEVTVPSRPKPRSLGITVHELRRESQEVRGYLVLFADTTDVKRRAEQRRLSESLAHMGELTAGIAHEMRNSLASLRGYLSRAEKGAADTPLRSDLEEIRHEADHLKRILDDFLSFAQPGTVRMAEVSLERVVRRAASDLEVAGKSVVIHSAEAAGAVRTPSASQATRESVATSTPTPATARGAIRRVWGDEQLLERALRNLLQNAADAEEEAGRGGNSLHVRLDFNDTAATVIVDDRGTGLHPEIREKLFVPFSSHKQQGIGLGLALARRILDLHGATLELENRDAGGARAIVRFPASSLVGREVSGASVEARHERNLGGAIL